MVWPWLVAIAAAVVGFAVGSILAARGALRSAEMEFRPQLNQLATASASDRQLLLTTFRRELANILIREDPDNYLRIYREAHSDAMTISNVTPQNRKEMMDAITSKYPMYENFDFIGTREHVLYADAVKNYDREQMEDHFKAMLRYQALLAAIDPEWSRYRPTDERNLKHLEEYVGRIKDSRLRRRIDEAVREFDVFRYAKGWSDVTSYETNKLSVRHVPHIAENRFGIHFKETNEFALYCFFADDSNKFYYSYYRSNPNFEECGSLLRHYPADNPI